MTQPRPMPKVRSLACPNCGGTVEVRGLGRTLTVVCIQCLSVLDATTPSLQVIEQFRAKERFRPLIPLGTRGKLDGVLYEAIGMQVREMTADGVAYHWSEYVLFNPYRGFRYLTEYNGHWNLVTVLQALPLATMRGTRPIANFMGATYRHFQDYQAATIYVMGEFPGASTWANPSSATISSPSAHALTRTDGRRDCLVAWRIHSGRRHLEKLRPPRKSS